MSERSVTLTLEPLGRALSVAAGAPLQDVLFAQGVEFPCGGRGRCKGCRVKVIAGELPVTSDDARLLSERELGEGWRLACRASAAGDLTIELAQWEATILADHSDFEFTPCEGLGIAIDVGTTTIAAQLLDRRNGHVLAVRTALNDQARHGADIMSRIEFAVHGGGQPLLARLIRRQLGSLIGELLEAAPASAEPVREVVLVGNTAMHHLFCGLDVTPLSMHPFESESDSEREFSAGDLDWRPAALENARVRFLPGLGSFVGSDVLAGVLATRMHDSAELCVLVDLGTNGEIVVGNRDRLLCASTAAGPAFEGARISCGMRADTGAIAEVTLAGGHLECRIIGHTLPRGICGSGLVDAVAVALDLGLVQPDGKLANGGTLPLLAPVELLQADIRELQLAKGAIAAGIQILLQQWGATAADVQRVWLAGAFGNYLNRTSARRIGLLDFPPEKIEAAGNTALLGAKLALFHPPGDDRVVESIRARTRHVPLNDDPEFMETFVGAMHFPPQDVNAPR